jgi:hypothetical protein
LLPGLTSTPITGHQLTGLALKELPEANLLIEDATQHLASNLTARMILTKKMTWDTIYLHLRDI